MAKKTVNSEIVYLDEAEHLLLRPTLYVGSVDPSEERLPIIKGGKLLSEVRTISVGFYKIFDETVDNAVDEAKRCASRGEPMKLIQVHVDTKTNLVKVQDTGSGFTNGTAVNNKTGLTNIETAVTRLRAGSNFNNEGTDVNLIGTNGVGISCTNVLSDFFSIETINKTHYYFKSWEQFESKKEEVTSKKRGSESGTSISFIPRKKIFPNQKWDVDIITTKLTFRQFLMKMDPALKDTTLQLFIDGKQVDISKSFIPEEAVKISAKYANLFVWESYDGGTSASFVNSALCSGPSLNIIRESINEILDYDKAHQFYDYCLVLDLPPKHVRFGDQNKTRFATGRSEMQPIFEQTIIPKIRKGMPNSDLWDILKERVEEATKGQELKKLKSARKASRNKISEKYFPSSGKKENLFIVEGVSARGSILQKRNTQTDAVYSLKGKIKNVRGVADLTGNQEILELMNILSLDLETKGKTCAFKRVIIATDADPDGLGHIASLLINFFYKWFPEVVTSNRLFILSMPLVSVDAGKKRKYFYSLAEYGKFAVGSSTPNERYLKGLGSMDSKDWEYVFGNMRLLQIAKDGGTDKILNMAFGEKSLLRKRWLEKTV